MHLPISLQVFERTPSTAFRSSMHALATAIQVESLLRRRRCQKPSSHSVVSLCPQRMPANNGAGSGPEITIRGASRGPSCCLPTERRPAFPSAILQTSHDRTASKASAGNSDDGQDKRTTRLAHGDVPLRVAAESTSRIAGVLLKVPHPTHHKFTVGCAPCSEGTLQITVHDLGITLRRYREWTWCSVDCNAAERAFIYSS